MRLTFLILALAGGALAPPAARTAQDARARGARERGDRLERPVALSEHQTRMRVEQFARADHWAMRGLVLLDLGGSWHPSGAEIVRAALKDDDEHLRAYGLEALLRTHPAILRQVMTPELIEELIGQLREEDELWRERVNELLGSLFPGADATDRVEWHRHWRERSESWAPDPWVPPPPIEGARTVAAAAVERALDLHEAGLDVCICIDSTGSMQPTINAVGKAVDDMVAMLEGVAPKFRLGLVHYRDLGDMGGGADVLEPLNSRPELVRDRLDRLEAAGGGDAPERVARGLAAALDPKAMRWGRSTNKLIVIVGDAPPHSLAEALKLAHDAYQRPFGVEATPADGTRVAGRTRSRPVRPFVTACIGVGTGRVSTRTADALREIAAAGGGAYAELVLGGARSPSEEIVANILKLSFGAQYADQLDVFVEVFLRWHRRGFFD